MQKGKVQPKPVAFLMFGMTGTVAANDDKAFTAKQHRPNLGPYSLGKPKVCLDCGKPGSKWVDGEACLPTTPEYA